MNQMASTAQTRLLTADASGIAEAARLLSGGGLVGLPTETVYGLAADAEDGQAVARIYAAKGRPAFNPLIAHLPSAEAARRHGLFDAPALALAAAFWPGPLTLVVPLNPASRISDLSRAGLETVGLRVPSHPAARAVLAQLGRPLAMPSANRSGHVSPTTAAHVLADLDGRIDAVLDGGPCGVGVESTIVACLGGAPRLLRAGGVPRARVEAVIGRTLGDGAESAGGPIAPGMLASHYAPRARLRLDVSAPAPGEAWLGFGRDPAEAASAMPASSLSPRGDIIEAAANLFGALRALDQAGAKVIAVAPIPADGLGEAIRDRLQRAAAPR
jgi:L-threonylcarbamoyladenylate synthase